MKILYLYRSKGDMIISEKGSSLLCVAINPLTVDENHIKEILEGHIFQGLIIDNDIQLNKECFHQVLASTSFSGTSILQVSDYYKDMLAEWSEGVLSLLYTTIDKENRLPLLKSLMDSQGRLVGTETMWIPVDKVCPEDGATVLCNNLMSELTGIPFIADYIDEPAGDKRRYFPKGFYVGTEQVTVTEWRYLPKPPRQ